MIEFRGVSKKYDQTVAVNNISFKVKEGENLILLGTSGCGKTTTLKMINRLIAPDSGTILIDGKDINLENKEALRKRIGYVLQNIGLFPHFTVAENIAVVPKLLGWNKTKIATRTAELMDKLHLPISYLDLFPRELSGGQQQRVGLARALVADPPILLMDEPFGALDNVTRTSIQQEFKELGELQKKTMVLVTHDVQEAFALGDRICLIDKGRLMQIGTPKELLFHPANAFAKTFLDGQRLALSFQVVKVKDLWDKLPDILEANAPCINWEMSVWEAMELLQSSATNLLYFSNEMGDYKTVGFEALNTTFNHYYNTFKHE